MEVGLLGWRTLKVSTAPVPVRSKIELVMSGISLPIQSWYMRMTLEAYIALLRILLSSTASDLSLLEIYMR